MLLQVAFYKGTDRLFNRAVSWWERGPYSHCELVIGFTDAGEAVCWSSSFRDGGVRKKIMVLQPDHWDLFTFEVSAEVAATAIQWFEDHEGQGYDLAGLVGFVWGPWAHRPDKWFCNEAVGAALGLREPWRYCPNGLAGLLWYGHSEVRLTA